MADALKADIDKAKGSGYGSLTFRGVDYPILRKPNTLLISELARTGSGDPEALGVFAEFFEATLGKDTYRTFKRAVFSADDEIDQAELSEALQQILENSLGRPTP